MSEAKRNSTRQTKRIGVREVARLAAVAPITVSRALSFPESVAPATRERILDAVASLGYIPNRVAGSLSSNQTRVIGAIIPGFQGSKATDFTDGMAKVLRSRGYQLLLGGSNFSIAEEESLVIEFLARRADGIYLTGTTHTQRTRRLLLESRVPCVEIASLDGEHIDMGVGFSNFDASFAMIRHLAQCGYRRVAFLSMPTRDNERQAARVAAFQRGVEVFGLDPDPALVAEAQMDLASASAAFSDLLGRRPDTEALFSASDLLAVGVLFECQRRGIRVPEDFGIAGFDNIELAQYVEPALTTVRLPHQAIGTRAAELLLDRIAGKPVGGSVVDMGFEIVVRGSTRSLP